MKRITLLQKIKFLEKATDNSLSMTQYTNTWDLHSFRDNSPFVITGNSEEGFNNRHVTGKTFEEVVNKAYDQLQK